MTEITPGAGIVEIVGGAPTVELWDIPPDDHPIYPLLGRVVAGWARIEHILDLIIWDLAGGAGPNAAQITAGLVGHESRCKCIIKRAKQHNLSEEVFAAVDRLKKPLDDLSVERNRAVHDPWMSERETKQSAQWRSMPKKSPNPTFGISLKDFRDLETLISDIRSAASEVAGLRDQALLELQSK